MFVTGKCRRQGGRFSLVFQPVRVLRDGLLCAAVAGACLTAAERALADTARADIVSTNVPTIIVESNGSQYTQVHGSSQSIQGEIRVELDAEVTGRIVSFEARPMLGLITNAGPAIWDHFSDSGYSKSYSFPRPKSVTETFNFTIARQQYSTFMVAACNAHADKLRVQGKSNGEIFGENRTLAIGVDVHVEAEMTGPERLNPPPQEVSAPHTIGIICERDDSLDPIAAPEIEGAYLVAKALPKNLRGACELQLNGSVISQHPNTQVKFVYVDDKGNVSDVKTVTTSGEANTTFSHKFQISAEHKAGKVRMVGQNHPFFSNWASFESQCSAPADDFKTVLPPKAVAVEAYATADTVMYRGLVCPAKVKIWGILLGRGAVEGHVALAADGKPEALEPYDIEDGQQVVVQGEHDLAWEGLQLPQQNVKFAMYVTNKQGAVVDQMETTQNFVCREPQVSGAVQGAPGEMAAEVPAPKSVNLLVSELGKTTKNGHVCPEKGRISAFVQSDGKGFSGTLAIFAGGSLQQEIDIDLPANHGTSYPYDYVLPWNRTTISGQTVIFSMKVWNQHQVEIASLEKTESFACTEIKTTGVAQIGGGFTTQPKDPLSSQPGRPSASTQLAVGPALAILSPKGTVRRGDIRLTGGPANATYELTYYRKGSGGYQKVTSAQLPKQMTGLTASFDLGALDSGLQWRLEVCPVMGGQGTCRTSDFRVPRLAAKQQQAPAQGTPFVIVPGAIPQQ